MNLLKLNFTLTLVLIASQLQAQELNQWPDLVQEVSIISTADSSMQPALYFTPDTDKPVPLLVALHTWSGDYKQQMSVPYANWAISKQWAFIHPDYHGPNYNPKSAGSDYVVQDILDAVAFMKETTRVDTSRIYLIGGSGGGYNSLQIVSRVPEIWAGVSVMVPISDLEAWYYENKKAGRSYADDIVNALGGKPSSSYFIERQYYLRSPVHHLENAKSVAVDIAAGIRDGHTGSVPITHSLRAFNVMASPTDQIPDSVITYLTKNAEVPEHLQVHISDSSYPESQQPLFRKVSENVRITLFDGSHETLYKAGLTWLEKQYKGTKAAF